MADSFDNPLDQGRLDRLVQSLRAADARWTERLAGERQAEARAKARQESEGRRVAREERVTEKRARQVEPRRVAEDERGTRAAERRVDAETRASRAVQERRQLLEGELRTQNAILRQRLDPRINDPRTYAGQRPAALPSERLSRSASFAAEAERREIEAERRALLQGGLVGNRGQRLALLSGAGGGLPPTRPPTTFVPPPPPPPPPGGGLRAALGNERVAPEANRAAQAARAEGEQIQYLARSARLSSDAFRRHGALTTEFISAAARGRVEIRELGFQVGATVAKFAGWTAAATSVYAMVAAVHELGTGAFASLEGVNLLQRIIPNLDTGRAQQQFRDLSREFALPIDDVAQAAYGQSKVFQDQNSTFEATRVALFAMKVGELDAATAQRTLTGIVQGFKLQASDLPHVFDTINQAQNKFGGNTGQIARGVAQAAGQWQAAGGHYRDLIALIQTGSRLTGRTGVEIGTALQRMAEIVQRPNRRQSIIQLLGIDPQDHSIFEIVKRAQQVVPHLDRSRQQVLANTLGTPQLAARILPILRNPELTNEIYNQLDPSKTKGSAARELARAQQSPTFQLQNMLKEFQRLGSALGQSGAYQPFIALVTTIGHGVELTTHLVEAFGKLPAPLRTALTYGGQLVAVMALMRRFNVGGLFPQGSGARALLGRNPNTLARAQVLEGLDAERNFYQEQRRGVVRSGGQLATSIPRQQALLTRLEATSYEEGSAEERRVIALRARITEMQDQLQVLIAEEGALVEQEIANQAQTNAFRQRTSIFNRQRQSVNEAAIAEGIPFTQPLGTNVAARPQRILAESEDVQRAVGPEAARAAGASATAQAAELAETQAAMAEQRSAVQRTLEKGGLSGKLAARGGGGLVGAARGFGNVALSAGRSLVGVGASLLAGLGPLDALIALGIALMIDSEKKAEQGRKDAAALGRSRNAHSAADLRRSADDLGGQGGLAGLALDPMAEQLRRRAAVIDREQNRRRLLAPSQILRDLRQNIRRAPDDDARQKALDQASREAATSAVAIGGRYGLHFGAQGKAVQAQLLATIRQESNDLNVAHGSLRESLRTLATPEDSAVIVTSLQNRIARFGFSRRNQRSAGQIIAGLRRKVTEASSPQDVEKYLQQIDSVQQTVQQSIEARLSRLTAQGAPPGQIQSARTTAIAQMRRATVTQTDREIRAVEHDIRANQRALQAVRRDLDRQFAGAIAGMIGATLAGQGGGALGGVGEALNSVTRAANAAGITSGTPHPGANKALRELRALRRQQRRALDQFVQGQDQAMKELDTSVFDARTGLLQSQTADPVAQAQIAVARLRQRVGILRRAGASVAEVDQALAEYNQAVQQLASAQLARFQATLARDTARATIGAGQGAVLQRQLSDARRYAAAVRAQGNNVDPTEYINAERAIYEAQKAIADYARQQAQAMVQARVAYGQSRTEDPVRQALLALRGARRSLRFAQTPAEELQAKAEINNRQRDYVHAKQQQKYDDILYQADIGKIERDVEISRLRALLKTVHGNRELRRNIRRQIYQLTHDSSQNLEDLDVGNVKLPTLYEIRRAATAARGGVQVTQNLTLRVNVSRPADAPLVFEQVDRFHRGAGRAAARAAGLA